MLLHERTGYAWHLLRLQLIAAETGGAGLDDPPGVLWRASNRQDLIGEMSLMLHLFAARTPQLAEAVRDCTSLQRRRVDLATLQGAELGDFHNALRLARCSGRELLLAVTILPGSRLVEEDLLALPDWEFNISHTALSRDWHPLDGGGLSVTDYREELLPEPQEPGGPAPATFDHWSQWGTAGPDSAAERGEDHGSVGELAARVDAVGAENARASRSRGRGGSGRRLIADLFGRARD